MIGASLMAAPVFAGVDGPGEDCPKKKKTATTEDSLDIYEEENKIQDDFVVPMYQSPGKQPLVKQIVGPVETATFDKSQVEANNVEQAKEEDPNSAMSFNFIYYIIDKFKFTDPLE